MSPSAFPRARLSKPALISICIVLVAVALVWTTGQQAGASTSNLPTSLSSGGPFLRNKGGMTPAAATITVNSSSDVVNGTDGLCTLREAVTAANTDTASGAVLGECAAGSGDDTITFTISGGDPGCSGGLCTITLTSGELLINTNLTIVGSGANVLTVQRSAAGGTPNFRIFDISPSLIVAISGLTISNGNVTGGSGGGIYNNQSNVTIGDCVVSGNTAQAGGGIFNDKSSTAATLTISNSTVSGNQTTNVGNPGGSGGGIRNTGTLTVTNTTISGNHTGNGIPMGIGGDGGGISNFGGALTLRNVTVSGNVTGNGTGGGRGGFGGGISNTGTLTMTNTTISGNQTGGPTGLPGVGGGVYNSGTANVTNATVTDNQTGATGNNGGLGFYGNGGGILNEVGGATTSIRNTIVASNRIATNASGKDISGTFNSQDYNLIGDLTSGGSLTGTTTHNIVNVNAQLGPLANNDGPTQTHALLAGSPALDAGDNCVFDNTCTAVLAAAVTTDQRGFNRRVDGPDADATATVDIGAYEKQPPLASLGDTSTNEDTQLVINFDGGDASSITSVTATSSNATLVPNDAAHLTVAMNGSTGVVTINPATNENGVTDITVTINRAASSEFVTFSLTVNPVDDAPSFAKGADQTVNEDVGAQTLNNWATAISSGPANESGQTVTFTVTNNNNGLFSSQPAVSSAGTLTYTPAADANGSATVTVTAKDDGGTANGGNDTSPAQTFTITVNAINDPPSFTKGADQAVNEDAGAQTVTTWATSISAGAPNESGQTMTFTVTNNNNALFSSQPAVNSAGTLTYTPAANANGSATVTVSAKDNGGGNDTSSPQSFTITVNVVNDPPSFTKGTDQTVNEDASAQTLNNWATAISPGPNESGQTVSFTVTNNSNSLFSSQPAVNSAGTLSYTPAADANGSATVTVIAKDDGGTTNNGVDTSPPQTFTITVNAVNDPPSFTKGANQTVNEDAGAQTVTNWATSISAGPNETGQTITFTLTNDNNALFSSQPAVSSAGTLTYTPAANANGSATVTVTAKDNGGGNDTSAPQTFTISVNAINDPPSFTKGANQTVNEDAGGQTVAGWATSISLGPSDESGQTVSFAVTNNNNGLFSSQPAVSASGTLTYTPGANANGSATVTVTATDNGGGNDTSAPQTFTITVTAVNDPPSFAKGADQTVNNNAGAQSVANWATSISAGPSNESSQTLTFQLTGNTNPGLFTAGPAVSSTGTLTYTPSSNAGGTTTITINLKDNGGTANSGVDTSASQTFTITVTPVGGFVNFASSSANTTENSGSTTVNVVRSGNTASAVTVNYATNADAGVPCSTANGVASPKCDFTTALGTLNFAAGETSKPITILISQDSFVEGPETITLTLSSPTNGAALGTPSSMSVTIADDTSEPPTNIIDDAGMFVRMHYHDFLNREGDQSGLDFWTGQMTNCGSSDLLVCRVNVSGAFFLSIEFQQTGYLVERIYKTGYGDATGTSQIGGSHQIFVPVVRANEFLTDTQRVGRGVVVNQTGWETVLENNKQAYALEFVQTSRFIGAFPTSMTPAQFVDKLNTNAGGVLSVSERTTAINLFGNAANTTNVNARAQALRQVAEDTDLYSAEFNRAFVLAEYFGYLRRNPNDAPEPTLDYTGYDFWLGKLNQANGDYIKAEMVKAFIASSEYRQRFGP